MGGVSGSYSIALTAPFSSISMAAAGGLSGPPDVIDIDLMARTLNVRLSEAEIESRLAALPPFQSRTTSKWLKRYSYFVTSADTGAVLSTDGGR